MTIESREHKHVWENFRVRYDASTILADVAQTCACGEIRFVRRRDSLSRAMYEAARNPDMAFWAHEEYRLICERARDPVWRVCLPQTHDEFEAAVRRLVA